MRIFPSIDLLDGRVVRLRQGDFGEVTDYGDDPVDVALKYEAEGAKFLHLVDLDGAKSGSPKHLAVALAISDMTRLKVQFGGGIRTEEDVLTAIEAGVGRVVLGSSLTDRDFARQMLGRFGERILPMIDARDGRVATHGWTDDSGEDAFAFAQDLKEMGAKAIAYTNIAHDGTLQGPDCEGTKRMAELTGLPVIASGGVASMDDIRALKKAGAAAAIVGRALYAGAFTLKQALATASEPVQ